MNDIEKIEEIVKAEELCHEKDKEYSKMTKLRQKIINSHPVPENDFLKALLKRKEELKQQRRKILSDTKTERLNEYRRKKEFRKNIAEIQEVSNQLKVISKERNDLFNSLNELGEKYGSAIYNKAWEEYKRRRDEKALTSQEQEKKDD